MPDTKISALTALDHFTADPSKTYVPLFDEDGTPLNRRMNFVNLRTTRLYAGNSGSAARFSSAGNGIAVITNDAGNDLSRLCLGGTTALFPSLKRNGTGLDFRLADDSGFAPITAAAIVSSNTIAATGAVSGTKFTASNTVTTSNPAIDAAQTWNAAGVAFTGIKFNASGDATSAAGSKLLELQLDSVARLTVNKTGLTAINGPAIAGNGEILTLTNSFGTASLRVATGGLFTVGGDIAAVGSASLISSSAHLKFGTGSDAGLLYVTTGVLQVTNGSSGLGALIASNVTTPPFAIVDGPSVDINPANSGIQTWTIGDNRTPTAVNFASGQSMTLHLAKSNSAYNVTWSTIGVVWVGGSPPVIPNTGAAAIVLYKIGSTVYGTKFGDVA